MNRWGLHAGGLLVALIVVSCGSVSGSGCPGGKVRDPGSFRAVALVGAVPRAASRGALRIAGRTVQLDGATQVLGSCNSPDAPCDARVFLRRGGKSAADVFYWSTDRPVVSVAAVNTNEYRFDGAVLALRDGMRWSVRHGLPIDGCGANDQAGLMRSRFGATFQLDAATGTVVSAGCNGCM